MYSKLPIDNRLCVVACWLLSVPMSCLKTNVLKDLFTNNSALWTRIIDNY